MEPKLDTLLSRKETAELLTARGFETAEATLATKASRGGGPQYRLFGRKPLYRWGDALDWALSRLSDVRSSTSEAEFQAIGRRAVPGNYPALATSQSIAELERPFGGAPEKLRGEYAAAIAAEDPHA